MVVLVVLVVVLVLLVIAGFKIYEGGLGWWVLRPLHDVAAL